MPASLPAVLGLAAGAFAGTNLDNAAVTVAMVATAPPDRDRRIAAGQVMGFAALVLGAIGMAALLFELSTRVIGLLGLVPLTLGIRGFIGLRHPSQPVGTTSPSTYPCSGWHASAAPSPRYSSSPWVKRS